MLRIQAIAFALAVAIGLPATAHAQSGRVVIDSDVKAKKGLYPIAVPMPMG